MQPKIVLLYLCIINIVNNVHAQDSEDAEPPEKPAPDTSGSQQQSNEHSKRNSVPIKPPPQKFNDKLAAVNVKSSDVPKFNEYDAQFTSHYKMTCGAKVQAISSVEGTARCMPDENDIVEIMNDDTIVVQDCLRAGLKP
ncbi:unnamed protein product [Angiostrongylus costaricensis]|uniref:LTD domain-containing protein n=1 Tax=Angiostrongylus costaricensis TaxID=334426 RepID=A0A0R3PQS4_ANGCS|nr:unnamed protein product [Angiostrongylus costaricensis]